MREICLSGSEGGGHSSELGAMMRRERRDGRDCCSHAGLGSDSSRWGAINALYCDKTGDAQSRKKPFARPTTRRTLPPRMDKMESRTSRYASICALYYEKTGMKFFVVSGS